MWEDVDVWEGVREGGGGGCGGCGGCGWRRRGGRKWEEEVEENVGGGAEDARMWVEDVEDVGDVEGWSESVVCRVSCVTCM